MDYIPLNLLLSPKLSFLLLRLHITTSITCLLAQRNVTLRSILSKDGTALLKQS